MPDFSNKFIILTATIAFIATSVEARADCPATNALRNRLVAQNTANINRVTSTKNCALIPGVLAFAARANATLDKAMIKADCTPQPARTSASELEAILRRACSKD